MIQPTTQAICPDTDFALSRTATNAPELSRCRNGAGHQTKEAGAAGAGISSLPVTLQNHIL